MKITKQAVRAMLDATTTERLEQYFLEVLQRENSSYSGDTTYDLLVGSTNFRTKDDINLEAATEALLKDGYQTSKILMDTIRVKRIDNISGGFYLGLRYNDSNYESEQYITFNSYDTVKERLDGERARLNAELDAI